MGVLAFTRISKYRIDKIVGVGGMGTVYLGFDELIDRVVAVKVLHPHLRAGTKNDDMESRFQQEAKAAARCMHPNIVTVFDYGTVGDLSYLVMEFVQGAELRDFIKSETRFTLQRSVEIILQVLAALCLAHDNGVVHRDIKPANILLLDSGLVKLTDFGVARLDTSDMTIDGNILGTPNYMSPEGLRGRAVDTRGDLFTVGLVLLELITWQRLNANLVDPDSVQGHLEEAAHDDPDVLAFEGLLHKALREDPDQRFQSAEEFQCGLKELISEGEYGSEYSTEPGSNNADSRIITARRAYRPAKDQPASAQWPQDVLLQLSEALAEDFGPVASVLVSKYAQRSGDFRDLTIALADCIEDEVRRRDFFTRLDKPALNSIRKAVHSDQYRRVLGQVFDEPEN